MRECQSAVSDSGERLRDRSVSVLAAWGDGGRVFNRAAAVAKLLARYAALPGSYGKRPTFASFVSAVAHPPSRISPAEGYLTQLRPRI